MGVQTLWYLRNVMSDSWTRPESGLQDPTDQWSWGHAWGNCVEPGSFCVYSNQHHHAGELFQTTLLSFGWLPDLFFPFTRVRITGPSHEQKLTLPMLTWTEKTHKGGTQRKECLKVIIGFVKSQNIFSTISGKLSHFVHKIHFFAIISIFISSSIQFRIIRWLIIFIGIGIKLL